MVMIWKELVSKASNLIPVEPISAKFYELEFKPLYQSELFGARYGNSPILLKIFCFEYSVENLWIVMVE